MVEADIGRIGWSGCMVDGVCVEGCRLAVVWCKGANAGGGGMAKLCGNEIPGPMGGIIFQNAGETMLLLLSVCWKAEFSVFRPTGSMDASENRLGSLLERETDVLAASTSSWKGLWSAIALGRKMS